MCQLCTDASIGNTAANAQQATLEYGYWFPWCFAIAYISVNTLQALTRRSFVTDGKKNLAASNKDHVCVRVQSNLSYDKQLSLINRHNGWFWFRLYIIIIMPSFLLVLAVADLVSNEST